MAASLPCAWNPVADSVRISIRDTGIGFDPRAAARIFEPFQSGFAGGTGLGLAIVYQILQAHKGQIRVETEPGSARSSSSNFRARVALVRPRGRTRTLRPNNCGRLAPLVGKA